MKFKTSPRAPAIPRSALRIRMNALAIIILISGTGVSPVRFKTDRISLAETHGRDARATMSGYSALRTPHFAFA